ncbi:hypothetical protein M2262_000491 [Pseudomonas sp. BIGb0408]|uniref:Uncharacterized protein n=1 Tax=Phytopseudomonas flavescens TaxID=29435 RepID=A0A7Y9XR75_9GAMM|nr:MULTISPECIES: hypothetical protein [Pseudomonas]MCW2290441.1 hypothetical protein [Pseudomonas sp. BIGb0408]NYH74986.1 hypothetical protein [Pseudomonas flavescens]
MRSTSNRSARRALLADLTADYLYISLPFMLLVGIKFYLASWQEIFLSSDWALGACIVFGQVTYKISKSVAKARANAQHYGLFTAHRFSLVVISAVIYCGMIIKPTMSLGAIQVIWFFVASFYHFRDGITAHLIDKAEIKQTNK